jgi:hypothetical protein
MSDVGVIPGKAVILAVNENAWEALSQAALVEMWESRTPGNTQLDQAAHRAGGVEDSL